MARDPMAIAAVSCALGAAIALAFIYGAGRLRTPRKGGDRDV